MKAKETHQATHDASTSELNELSCVAVHHSRLSPCCPSVESKYSLCVFQVLINPSQQMTKNCTKMNLTQRALDAITCACVCACVCVCERMSEYAPHCNACVSCVHAAHERKRDAVRLKKTSARSQGL